MNNLLKYRGKHGLTLEELGSKLNLTRARVSALEKGKLSPALATRCAEVLGENVFALMGADALTLLPVTEEDKEILIDLIRGM